MEFLGINIDELPEHKDKAIDFARSVDQAMFNDVLSYKIKAKKENQLPRDRIMVSELFTEKLSIVKNFIENKKNSDPSEIEKLDKLLKLLENYYSILNDKFNKEYKAYGIMLYPNSFAKVLYNERDLFFLEVPVNKLNILRTYRQTIPLFLDFELYNQIKKALFLYSKSVQSHIELSDDALTFIQQAINEVKGLMKESHIKIIISTDLDISQLNKTIKIEPSVKDLQNAFINIILKLNHDRVKIKLKDQANQNKMYVKNEKRYLKELSTFASEKEELMSSLINYGDKANKEKIEIPEEPEDIFKFLREIAGKKKNENS